MKREKPDGCENCGYVTQGLRDFNVALATAPEYEWLCGLCANMESRENSRDICFVGNMILEELASLKEQIKALRRGWKEEE